MDPNTLTLICAGLWVLGALFVWSFVRIAALTDIAAGRSDGLKNVYNDDQ